jgi:hypothetical protein
MVFARETNPGLTSLVKKLDAATVKNADAKMGSFVVFCNDDEKLEGALKEWAEKDGIKKTILAIDNPAGPDSMKVDKDADVTVVLYLKKKVKFNHAFKKGELTPKAVDQVVADVTKVIADKKKADEEMKAKEEEEKKKEKEKDKQ